MYVSTELLNGVSPPAAQPFLLTPLVHSGGVKQYPELKFIASVLFVVSLQCFTIWTVSRTFQVKKNLESWLLH